MLKRTLITLATPALIAGGLVVTGASAASAVPVECKLHRADHDRTSVAHCRHHRTYQHWIRCESKDGTITEETTKEFTGKRNRLTCDEDYKLVHHSIGV